MSGLNTQNTAPVSEADTTELDEALARFKKKDKLVALANDDQETFMVVVNTVGAGNYKDWAEGAPEAFTGLALVRTDSGEARVISIADEDNAFADPAVRKALYRIYVNRVVNSAMDVDATQAQFMVPGGCFKQKFDLDAFKFQQKTLVKVLKKQKVIGVTTNALRMAFASAAFAASQFPRITKDAWLTILGIAEQNAQTHGYDIAIFDHWKATREVQSADTSIIALDFAKLQAATAAMDDDAGDDDEDEATPETPVAAAS